MRPGTTEILILVLLVLLLFGASRLPKLARSMREARDEFQKGADEAGGPATPSASEQPTGEASPSNGERPTGGG